jgi:hypothetical protein
MREQLPQADNGFAALRRFRTKLRQPAISRVVKIKYLAFHQRHCRGRNHGFGE